jgi:superfamily II DNA/RNA helicase
VNFEYLGLAPETLRAVEEAGYTEPTPIQAQAIPVVLQGRDVLGIAQTGTGKTASFTLPMIDILSQGRARARMPRSLILEPTRELAAQVAQNFEIYGKYHKLNMALLIGGVSFDDQERKLDRGVDVLIATPGRLLDHFGRGKLMMNGVDILVIDEADRMLDMGFIPDVERICSLITKKHQTLFFSATMPREIQNLVSKFLTDPKRIEVAPPSSTAANVEQFLVPLNTSEAGAKRAKLRELLRGEEIKNAIIFCNRKRDVDVVYRSLQKHGFDAAALHGDMDQGSRSEVLEKFKGGNLRLLIASDVAARGLDIPAMSHVFNYDVPSHAEDYIHRIGRTGRAGRSGRTFMLSTPADSKWLRNVQSLIGKSITVISGAVPPGTGASGDSSAPAQAESATIATETFISDASDEKRGKRRRRKKADRGGQAQPAADLPETDAPQPLAGQPQPQPPQQQADDMDEPRRNRDNNRQGSGRDEPRRQEARRDEPRREEKRRDEPRRDDRRGDRSRNDRGGRGREPRHYRDDDFEPVVGLGDHVPEFLLRTFKIAPIPADDDEDEVELDIMDMDAPDTDADQSYADDTAAYDTDDEDDADDVVAETTPVQEASEPAERTRSKRKRRSRGKKSGGRDAVAQTQAADIVPDEAPEPFQAQPELDANVAPEDVEQPAAKPKRARKPRAKAAPAVADAAPIAETAVDAAPVAEAKPKAKPRRAAKAKAAPDTEPAAEAVAAEPTADAAPAKAKPARKPRAPRKSPAKAA